MKILSVLLLCAIFFACENDQAHIAIESGKTYQLVDPVKDMVVGTVVFSDQNYVLNVNKNISGPEGFVHSSARLIGQLRTSPGAITLYETTYQDLGAYDRWGSPIDLTMHQDLRAKITEATPLYECKKVTVAGDQLILL